MKGEMSFIIGVICRGGLVNLDKRNLRWMIDYSEHLVVFSNNPEDKSVIYVNCPDEELDLRSLTWMYENRKVDYYVSIIGSDGLLITKDSLQRSFIDSERYGVYHMDWSVFTRKFLESTGRDKEKEFSVSCV